MSLVTRNVLIALVITAAIGGSVIYAVNYLNQLRVQNLSAVQEQLSIEILSLETQISLFESAPCSIVSTGTELTSELDELGQHLSYTENQLGSSDPQVVLLKQQYTLLEIRDYLVTRQLGRQCNTKQITVLYFYSNDKDCTSCDRAGYALSYLHNTYPNMRVYSFDYDLKLPALQTLVSLEGLTGELPAFVISDRKPAYGFTNLEDLEALIPELKTLASSTTATSTKTK